MINMDNPYYQELAQLIEVYHDEGFSWEDSQRIALRDMARLHGWEPS